MPSDPTAFGVAGAVALLFWAYAWSKVLAILYVMQRD